jgi:hypothetical protein
MIYTPQQMLYDNKSRKVELTGHVEQMGERRDANRILKGRPERRRPRWRIILKS